MAILKIGTVNDLALEFPNEIQLAKFLKNEGFRGQMQNAISLKKAK